MTLYNYSSNNKIQLEIVDLSFWNLYKTQCNVSIKFQVHIT